MRESTCVRSEAGLRSEFGLIEGEEAVMSALKKISRVSQGSRGEVVVWGGRMCCN